jgi:hypothetical protein
MGRPDNKIGCAILTDGLPLIEKLGS